MIADDHELLRRYAHEKSEEAFAELVRRHLDLVHSAALRQVGGDAHLAQDVAQQVFAALARKAAALVSHRVLAAWLFTSTRYEAAKRVRGERRRRAREEEIRLMHEIVNETEPAPEWDRIRPALDEAVGALSERDREAVLLRFFEGRSFAVIGERIRLSENAARMRVERALEKLRVELGRRGVGSTAAALATVLANQAVVAAPAGLAGTVASAAVSGAGGGAVAAITFMTIGKLQVGIAAALVVAGVAGFVVQRQDQQALRAEIENLRVENRAVASLREENRRLAQASAEAAAARADEAERLRLAEEAAVLAERVRTLMASRLAAAQRRAGATGTTGAAPSAGPHPDREATVKVQPRPAYPEALRRAGVAGEVEVSFIIDSEGRVHSPSVLKSTQSEFETVSLEAVSAWGFDPGFRRGRAVNTRMQAVIVFDPAQAEGVPELKDPPAPEWF